MVLHELILIPIEISFELLTSLFLLLLLVLICLQSSLFDCSLFD